MLSFYCWNIISQEGSTICKLGCLPVSEEGLTLTNFVVALSTSLKFLDLAIFWYTLCIIAVNLWECFCIWDYAPNSKWYWHTKLKLKMNHGLYLKLFKLIESISFLLFWKQRKTSRRLTSFWKSTTQHGEHWSHLFFPMVRFCLDYPLFL